MDGGSRARRARITGPAWNTPAPSVSSFTGVQGIAGGVDDDAEVAPERRQHKGELFTHNLLCRVVIV